MLTEAQVEQAARRLCELREWDENEDVGLDEHPETFRCAIDVCKDEVRAADQVREAIAYVEKVAAPGPCECGHSHAEHLRARVNDENLRG